MREFKGPVLAYGTMRKLETAGITSQDKVAQLKLEDLKELGVATHFAKQIVSYSQRLLTDKDYKLPLHVGPAR
jgi:hypothetical protein